MGQLDGKIAVVTGAGSGIGLAIAERFGAEGAEVILVGRQKERLDEAAARIGGGARGVSVDVGEEEQVRQLIEDLPRVDILCTCAGKAVFGAVDEVPPSCVEGPLSRALLRPALRRPLRRTQDARRLGDPALLGHRGQAAYVPDYAGGAAIAGAVNAMAKNLAVELAPRSIRVNVLSPGFIIGTDIKFNLEGEKAIEFVKRSIADTPLPYHGRTRRISPMRPCSWPPAASSRARWSRSTGVGRPPEDLHPPVSDGVSEYRDVRGVRARTARLYAVAASGPRKRHSSSATASGCAARRCVRRSGSSPPSPSRSARCAARPAPS